MEHGVHRIVPDLILENYKQGRYAGSLEAASMFLDISGFSTMTDTLMGQGREGAEILAVMMAEVFDPIVEAIFAQGGMITGYAGDSISAVFPVETDERQAAWRALASADAIQAGLRSKPVFENAYGSFRIAAKIGLGLGTVTWGILRSHEGDQAIYYFRGEAIDEAARSEHRALAGDIVLSKRCLGSLEGDVESEALADAHVVRRIRGNPPARREIRLAPVDPEAASVFAPSDVLTTTLRGEFRQTVVLFARVPEVDAEALQGFAGTFLDLRRRYGGLIDRVDFGDKGCNLMVMWGAPIAHENDIDRALGFALDLQREANLPITAGVTYYMSHAGFVGSRLFETYTAYGWGVNLAARFMMNATEGDVWLDERIYQRVKSRFYADFIAEQSFKGFAQRQKVYLLRGRKSGAEAYFRGRMVGRERELQALTEFVQPLWDGQYAGVAGIWGEAGMGKSRLLYEFRHSPLFQEHDCLWARCQCDEIVRRSFNPLRFWLFRYFEIRPSDNQGRRMEKFVSKMEGLLAFTGSTALTGDLQRGRAFLASLVEVQWPDALADQLDAQGRYDNTIGGLIALLKAESLRQPLIVSVEDAQYLDEDTTAFIPRLKRALQADPVPHPITILIATRWQGTKILMEDGLIDRDIDLEALGDASIAAMCADYLGGQASADLVKVVNERVEGNPFFTEQILRYLQEQDLLEPDDSGAWRMKRRQGSSVLPADISAILLARLDALPGRVKEVIQAASVLGRAFDLGVLNRMLANESELHHGISIGEQAAIWSPLSETRYIFNHALLRDMAYTMQLRSRREELHARAYAALSGLFASETQHHYADLAYHSEQGGLTMEARRYLVLAAEAARDQYQNSQALDLHRRALALIPETDLEERYRLHIECEKILTELGQTDQRAREIEILEGLAQAMGDGGHESQVLLLRARLLHSKGEYAASGEFAEQALTKAVMSGRQDVEVGAYLNLLDAAYLRGRYKEGLEYGKAGLEAARKTNGHASEGALLNLLGLTYLEMQNPSAARSYYDQCLAIFRAEGNLRGVTLALGNLGSVSAYQGNYHAALEYDEQALRLARETGQHMQECGLLANMGWLWGLQGDYASARVHAERALQIAREMGNLHIQTLTVINLSSYAGGQGDYETAIECAQRGLLLARRSGDRSAEAWALTYLGHGLCEVGRLDEAAEAYREALEVRGELEQSVLGTEPAAGMARIAWTQKEPSRAFELVNQILHQIELDGTLEGTDQPLRVYLWCYRVLEGLGDERAAGILGRAHDLLKQRANGLSDPLARKTFLENIDCNREIMALWDRRHRHAIPM